MNMIGHNDNNMQFAGLLVLGDAAVEHDCTGACRKIPALFSSKCYEDWPVTFEQMGQPPAVIVFSNGWHVVALNRRNKFRRYTLNSFFTVSLTTLPSTRAPANLAITFFITAPISLIVGEPISAMTARTVAAISSSPIALGM